MQCAIPTIFKNKIKNKNITTALHFDSSDNKVPTTSTEQLLSVNVTSLDDAMSKLQNALLQAEQAKKETERAELKLKEANMMILKLNKSKMIFKKRIRKVVDENKKLTEQIRTLKANKNLHIFNDDQITVLNKKSQGYKWSNNTIIKALRLKLSCGSGYKELLNQNIPLPSERTLRRKLENINFESGVCDQIFDILKQQVTIIQ